mmetsp:Transcript_14603/g.26145  ORF Transcript_14603/g.26145 Transcript_14603/m.26145 type:complete len:239 (-) Transcript_14603:450-1166(-)
MPRLIDILLHKAPPIPKRIQRLVTRQTKHAFQIIGGRNNTYPTSTSAHGSLDNDRIRDRIGGIFDPVLGFGGRRKGGIGSRDDRHVRFYGEFFRGGFVAERVEILHRGTHELDSILLQLFGEGCILAQKSISGMDRLHAILNAYLDDGIDIEVGCYRRFGRGEFECLIRLVSMLGESIFVRIYSNSAASQFATRPHDTRGNLTAIGCHELFEWTWCSRVRCRIVIIIIGGSGSGGEAS